MGQYPQPKFDIGQKVCTLKYLDLGNKYCEHCKDFLCSHKYKWIVEEIEIREVKITKTVIGSFNIDYQGYSVLEWYSEMNTYATKEEAEEKVKSLNRE